MGSGIFGGGGEVAGVSRAGVMHRRARRPAARSRPEPMHPATRALQRRRGGSSPTRTTRAALHPSQPVQYGTHLQHGRRQLAHVFKLELDDSVHLHLFGQPLAHHLGQHLLLGLHSRRRGMGWQRGQAGAASVSWERRRAVEWQGLQCGRLAGSRKAGGRAGGGGTPDASAPHAPHLRLARQLGGAVAEAGNVLLHVSNLWVWVGGWVRVGRWAEGVKASLPQAESVQARLQHASRSLASPRFAAFATCACSHVYFSSLSDCILTATHSDPALLNPALPTALCAPPLCPPAPAPTCTSSSGSPRAPPACAHTCHSRLQGGGGGGRWSMSAR